jgi:hypothetical protein
MITCLNCGTEIAVSWRNGTRIPEGGTVKDCKECSIHDPKIRSKK